MRQQSKGATSRLYSSVSNRGRTLINFHQSFRHPKFIKFQGMKNDLEDFSLRKGTVLLNNSVSFTKWMCYLLLFWKRR